MLDQRPPMIIGGKSDTGIGRTQSSTSSWPGSSQHTSYVVQYFQTNAALEDWHTIRDATRTFHSTCNPAQLMNEEVTTRVVDESMELSWNPGASELLEPGTQLETSQGGTLMDLVEASLSYPSANMPRSFELVVDGSVPCEYLGAFLRLEEPAKKAAERRSSLSESSAAMELERARERQCAQKQVEQHQPDQLRSSSRDDSEPSGSAGLTNEPQPEEMLSRT